MTLQNLSRILDKYEQQFGSTNIQAFDRLKDLPFYNWSPKETDDRKFNHPGQEATTDFNRAIGLPQKDGVAYPLFDYERLLFDTLQNHKHIWIKKATGLGVTEFMLRYMAWLCFQNGKKSNIGQIDHNIVPGSQMCIVTGPRIELAITLIDRMKGLFQSNSLPNSGNKSFDTKETVIELNGVHIEAYPSHHLDAMRGLANLSFIYIDEGDFFPPGQQQDARDVSERYIGKSNPWIVMVSTPNAPEGLFERIEKEPEDTCLYKRLFLDYTYGLDRIYTEQEIAEARRSPSFEREYNLKYLGLIGNVFHTKDIEVAMEKGKRFLPDSGTNSYTSKSVGLDPGFGEQ